MSKDLHSIAIRIYKLCLKNKIELKIAWIKHKCFDLEEKAWGPHTIDCFENYYNAKNSKILFLELEPWLFRGRFFVQNIVGENCLVVPPT